MNALPSAAPIPPKLLEAIYRAIDEANQQQEADRKIAKAPGTVLLGDASFLDSVGLINFVIALEQQVEQRLGATVSLTANPDMFSTESPLRSVQTLADFLAQELPPSALA
jgi:hypothetical protein